MQSDWPTCPRCRTKAETLPEAAPEPEDVIETEPLEPKRHAIPKANGSGIGFLLVVVVAGLLFAMFGSLYN